MASSRSRGLVEVIFPFAHSDTLYFSDTQDAGTAGPSLMAQWQEDYESSQLPGVSYEDMKLLGLCTYVGQ